MADFPQILASENEVVVVPGTPEVVIPAVPQRQYDRYWITRLRILSPDPNAPTTALVILTKGCKNADGTWELSPNPEDVKTVEIDDVFAMAASNPDLAQVMGGLLAVIGAIGTAQGKL